MVTLLDDWKSVKSVYSHRFHDKEWVHSWFRSQVSDRIQGRRHFYRFQWRLGAITELKREYKRVGEKVAQLKSVDADGWRFAEWINEREQHWIRDKISPTNILECAFGESDWIQCNDCNKIESLDESIFCYNDYHICSDCRDDYVYCDERDTYVERGDEYESEDEDEPEYRLIGNYHSSKRVLGHIPSSYDNRKPRVLLGLELEMEANRDDVDDLDDRAEVLLDEMEYHKGTRYCALEQDGSLDYGFEMVTGYTGLDVHQKQLEFFKNRFEGMRSHDTRTCGLHIHICKSDMSIYHAMKMVLFINDTGNANLIRALARRDASSYAKFKDKKGDTSWVKDANRARANKSDKLRCLNADRYEALNFQNEKTIEFRLFKGTLKYETIMACLEFTYATWFFTRDSSTYDLTAEKFLEFIQKPEQKQDTKFLRAYLTEKGFLKARSPKHDLAVEAV